MGKNKRSIFVSITRKEARKEMDKLKEMLGRDLTKKEKHEIVKEKARKAKMKLFAVTLAGAIGIGAGVGIGMESSKLLNPGQDKITESDEEITLDLTDADKDVTIENMKSDKELFVNGLKVDFSQDANELEDNVREEIENLETKEEVYTYMKEMYAEEYEEIYGQEIDIENIKFSRAREGFLIYKDDEGRHRVCYSSKDAEEVGKRGIIDNNSSFISVDIKDEIENRYKVHEKVTNYNYTDEYYILYNKNEEVTADNNNSALLKLAEVVDKGIDRAESMNIEENSYKQNNAYKESFIDAVVEYKESKIQEIIDGNTQTNTQQKSSNQEGR